MCTSIPSPLLRSVPATLTGLPSAGSRLLRVFYSMAAALLAPNTVLPTRANTFPWIAHESKSMAGSVADLNSRHRAAYSSRTSIPASVITAASRCMSAMFCACKVLSRSMSSSLSMGEICGHAAILSTSKNRGVLLCLTA